MQDSTGSKEISPKQHFRLSVRELVAYLPQGGDLSDSVFSSGRPVAGIHAHQKIQKKRPEYYTPEVSVAHTVETDNYVIEIGGRIDGVFHLADHDILEEIKTTTRDLAAVEKSQNPHHWAQLKMYAYIYAARHDLEEMETCLTYVQLGSYKELEIRKSFDCEELAEYFNRLVSLFVSCADERRKWGEKRDQSIKTMVFPFSSYRKGQRAMAVGVFQAARERQQLLVQAPTGIGKTLAAVFPAIKAVGEGLVQRVFYLAARSTGKQVAEETVSVLLRRGLRFKCLTLTAKDKICFNPGAGCNGDECEFARGYYDRIDTALEYGLAGDLLDRHHIETIARQHRVCPFELSLDMSLKADCIICDYNYAFDPQAYLRRFFQIVEEDYLFLVDEAHNLVDRSRSMFSADISRQAFVEGREALKNELPQLQQTLAEIDAWMVAFRDTQNGRFLSTSELPDALISLLRQFTETCEAWLSLNIKALFREVLLDLFFACARFIKVSDLFDERYAVCYDFSRVDMRINLFCIDPSSHLQKRLADIRSVAFYSATLTPMNYFREIFGCDPSSPELILPSPFPSENFSLTVAGGISTFFKEREKTKSVVAQTIAAFVSRKKGNYLVFFPSYGYLSTVLPVFEKIGEDLDVISQSPGMSEPEREEFIRGFAGNNIRTRVGFAVLGGVFGEGIDLVGDRLDGVVVVSVGMPPPTPERELIRSYFDKSHNTGWEFAYVFPGFNRVLQAVGRVIRTETDRGAALLIDRRFGSARYRSMFPTDWEPSRINSMRFGN